MRISGGKARGIPLKVSKRGGVRPAIETTRERLFSSIFQLVKDATVLDLFAGSGAYGLESLSRGARQATLVEKNRLVFNDLKSNLTAVLKSANLQGDAARLINRDVLDFVKEPPNQNYDIIYIDPPYAEIEKFGPQIFEFLLRNKYLSANGIAVLETPGELQMEFPGWSIIRVVGNEKRGSPLHRIYSSAHPLPGQEWAER